MMHDRNTECDCCPPIKSIATLWCLECKRNLCESCDNKIHSINSFEIHKRESINEKKQSMPNCDKHKSEKVQYYLCETNKFVCSECIAEKKIIKIEIHLENKKNELLKKVSDLSNITKLEEEKEKYIEINKRIEDKIKNIQSTIFETKENELSLTKSIKELREIDMMNEDKIKDFNNKIEQSFHKIGSNGSENCQFCNLYGVVVNKTIRIVHLSNMDQYSPVDNLLPYGTKTIRNVSPNCFDNCDAVLVTHWSSVNVQLAEELLTNVFMRGGTVVICCFGNALNYQAPLGKFQHLHALVPSRENNAQATLGSVKIANHPLMHGIKQITQGSDKRRMNGQVADGAELIVEWNDGSPMAAIRVKEGIVVSLSFQIGAVGAQGDAMKMVWNALMLTKV